MITYRPKAGQGGHTTSKFVLGPKIWKRFVMSGCSLGRKRSRNIEVECAF